MSDALIEELEVLESIYPTELHKISSDNIEIEAEADEVPDGMDNVKVTLCVRYPESYPGVLPELSIRPENDDVTDEDISNLISGLKTVGEENIGMAMTFTLVSQLREQLSQLIQSKLAEQKWQEAEQARLELEEEERRTRGTPVTVESFKAWKHKFDQEVAAKRAAEEEDRLKNMTPKEREERKRLQTRLSGRQLFERNRHMVEDESLLEEGAVSVDFSQYDRSHLQEDVKEDETLTFSDSD